MRLIDADELKKELYQQWFMDILLRQRNSEDIFYALAQKIDEQPTDYDVDKIVEQLEERVSFLEDCSKHEHQTEEQRAKSYSTMMMYEVAVLVNDLIEIVKRGGIDER